MNLNELLEHPDASVRAAALALQRAERHLAARLNAFEHRGEAKAARHERRAKVREMEPVRHAPPSTFPHPAPRRHTPKAKPVRRSNPCQTHQQAIRRLAA